MFVTLEGMEGSGKSTLARGLAARFAADGRRVVVTREPGGCALGGRIRSILLDAGSVISARAELFLFLADRAQHVEEIVRPALERGDVVISDRYADSTIVYQGCGRGLDMEELRRLNDAAVRGLWPDRTFVLDLPPEVGLARARGRNERDGVAVTEGRFEAEAVAFHVAVREGFLRWAGLNAPRCVTLDAMLPPEALLDLAWSRLR